MTTTTTTEALPQVRYTITWTEVSHHEVTVTAEELDRLRQAGGCDVDDPDSDLSEGLEDGLADLDDDGFEFLTREDIGVTELERDDSQIAAAA